MWFPSECEATTHTHTHVAYTHFRPFSPISFIYCFSNGALSNGYSLVACFRGMEFTVSVRERARLKRGERERHWGEREGIWMERGTQKFVAAGVCVGSWEMLLEEGREEVKAGQGSSWFCERTLEGLCESVSAWMLLALGRNLEGFSCWTFRNFTWLLFKWYFVEVQTDKEHFAIARYDKMDFLSDPDVITPILVVAFHFLTAAGFWYYRRRCRQMPIIDAGKLSLSTAVFLLLTASVMTYMSRSMCFLFRLRLFCFFVSMSVSLFPLYYQYL